MQTLIQFHRRRGSMYVAVIGCSLVITVIGVSALLAARIERRAAEGTSDLSDARVYAQSAIDLGMYTILSDANWRTNKTNGYWRGNCDVNPPQLVTIGDGRTQTCTVDGDCSGYCIKVVDPIDEILSNSPSDPVVLCGTGSMGQARYKLQVTMVAKPKPLTCLQVAMHAGTNLTFSSATVQSNQVTVSANGSATASSSWVYPKVEVVNTASGSYQTPPKTGITPRTMPDATAFDYYIANGTPITYASILKSGGQVTLEKDFLSPNRNPYGVTNAKGIYVINCLLGDLRIRNFRIVGTLVILNPGVFSVQQAVNWEPGIANYPSLLVRGNAELAFSSGALSESSLGVNFNEDTNKTDTYPSLIKGLVYASGNVTTKTSVTIDGVLVIGGTLTAQNTLTLTYESTFLDNPPPGFAGAPEMVISPGTWKQLVD